MSGQNATVCEERYVKMKENPEHPDNIDALIENFDKALSHPDADDMERLKILLFSRRYYICTISHLTFQQKSISEGYHFELIRAQGIWQQGAFSVRRRLYKEKRSLRYRNEDP